MANKHLRNRKSFFGRPVWRNSTKTLKVNPLKYYTPKTLDDLITIVKEAIESQIEVRAVGSGHSYSTAPEATEILVDTDDLGQFIGPYKHTTQNSPLFEVQGGIKMKALNKKLDSLGYCISAMGAIDHQSAAGAISTGTHGSSMAFGTMSNMVKSMVIVTNDLADPVKVKVYRLEPVNGITDPSQYPDDQPQLIQEDDAFYSALLGFGCFGIIYSYVMEVEEMYYFTECKKLTTWEDAQDQLKNGLFEKHPSVFVQMNPYPYKNQQHALVVTHNREPAGKKNLIIQRAKRKLWHNLKRKMRAPLIELLGAFPYLFWISVWTLNRKPGSINKQIDQAVKSQRDEEYYSKGYRVMYQGLDYIKERAYDSEIAVPIKDNKYLEVINQLIDYLQELHDLYNIHLTSPLSLRFVKENNVYLDPAYQEAVCYIDCPVILYVYGAETMIEKIQEFVEAKQLRIHWGKKNDLLDHEYMKERYPKFDTWREQAIRFNPLQLFSNRFSRQMVDW